MYASALGAIIDHQTEQAPLRILVANETREDIQQIAELALQIGEVVIASEVDISKVGRIAEVELPDLALVGLRGDTEHALGMIAALVERRICPVIALLAEENEKFIEDASKYGISAYASPVEAEELRGAIDVALRSFERHEEIEGALQRRAEIECAKGVLMERYGLDRARAFEVLRHQARNAGLKIGAAAEIVVDGHRLLPRELGGQARADPERTTPG